MKKAPDFNKSRIPLLVVLIIITIIAAIFVVRNNSETSNFDNAKINGDFNGNCTMEDGPNIILNFSFNGEGKFNGSIQWNNQTLNFSDNFYMCVDNYIQFNVFISDNEYSFDFNGTINSDNTMINGDIRFYESYSTKSPNNGIFWLSKAI